MRRILEGTLAEDRGRLEIDGRELDDELRALVVALEPHDDPVMYRIVVEPLD